VLILRALSLGLLRCTPPDVRCIPLICATLVALVGAAGDAMAASMDRAIVPGQEELLSKMLGRGVMLPGGCRFAGGHVDAALVTAEYTCGTETVTFELQNPEDAPPSALRTQEFALVARHGSVPRDLAEALRDTIRAQEAGLEWTQVLGLRKQVAGRHLDPRALASCAAAILVLGLVTQYVVARRLSAAPTSAPQASSRDSTPAAGELHRGRHWVRTLSILSVVGVYVLTRLTLLTRLPVYVDESVHIHWARSLLDRDFVAEFSVGRWLPIRIMGLFVLLPFDPLASARLASVAMGLATLVACIFIDSELFALTEGLLAGVIYTLLPYTVLYDRLALADIYQTAFGAWVLFSSIAMIRRQRPAAVMMISVCTCGAILTKPTGALFLGIPVLVSIFLVRGGHRAAYLRRVAPTLVAGTALLLFLLWAGYGTGLLASQAAFEGAGQIEAILIPNLVMACQWLVTLLTPAAAFLTSAAAGFALVGIILGANREAFLAVLLLMLIIPYAAIARTWYPSYLLFAVVPVSLLLSRAITACAAGVSRLVAKLDRRLATVVEGAVCGLITVGLVGASVPLDVALLTHPEDAALPSIESARYVSGGLSGYGLPELAVYLQTQAQHAPINVARFDMVAPPKEGLDVYLTPIDSLRVYTVDHRDERAAAQIARLAHERRTLFVSNPEAEESSGVKATHYLGRAERVWSYNRPGFLSRLEVWEVQPGYDTSEDVGPHG
jgi:dolichyl-phosphate-mannose-protein mannosyltransferase